MTPAGDFPKSGAGGGALQTILICRDVFNYVGCRALRYRFGCCSWWSLRRGYDCLDAEVEVLLRPLDGGAEVCVRGADLDDRGIVAVRAPGVPANQGRQPLIAVAS